MGRVDGWVDERIENLFLDNGDFDKKAKIFVLHKNRARKKYCVQCEKYLILISKLDY